MVNKHITMIVAMTEDNVIGIDNELPWPKNKADMFLFQEITLGKTVIMGYNTFVSMKRKPLKGRVNIVLSKNHSRLESDDPSILFAKTKQEALSLSSGDIAIIGGAQIYDLFVDDTSYVYVSLMRVTSDQCIEYLKQKNRHPPFLYEKTKFKTSLDDFDIVNMIEVGVINDLTPNFAFIKYKRKDG